MRDHVTSTDKPQTVSPLGNEVPESEPTKSTATEATIKEDSYTTSEPDDDKSLKTTKSEQKEGEEKESDIFDITSEHTVIDNAAELSTESVRESHVTTSVDLLTRIADENTQEVSLDEKLTTESSITESSTESTISQDDRKSTTIAIEEEKIKETSDQDFTTIATAEKQDEETEMSSTKSPTVDDEMKDLTKTDVNTSEEKQPEESTTIISEVTEKSSESSSPVEETSTEQNVGMEITESIVSTPSVKSEEPVDTAQKTDFTTERDQITTIESTSEEIQDNQAGDRATSQSPETSPVGISTDDNITQQPGVAISPGSTTVSSGDSVSGETETPTGTKISTASIAGDDEKPVEINTEASPETSTTVSLDEDIITDEPITVISPESSTSYSDDITSEETNAPASTEGSTQAAPEDSKKPGEMAGSSNEDEKIGDPNEVISPESPTTISIDDKEPSGQTDISPSTETSTAEKSEEEEKPVEIDTTATPETSTETDLDEREKPKETDVTIIPDSSTDAILTGGEEVGQTDTPISNETPTSSGEDEIADENTSIAASSSTVDYTSAKLGVDEISSQSTTETSSSTASSSEDEAAEPNIPDEGPNGIRIPDRVPEHKAEDKDAVTDTEVTQGYIPTGSGVPHNIDNLQTEHPEFGPTTYLPPLGSSTEIDRQLSTPLYEELPKEDSDVEGQTTELTITPKAPSDKTTISHTEEIPESGKSEEKKEPSESTPGLPLEEKPSDETASAKTSSQETSTEPIQPTGQVGDEHTTIDSTSAPKVSEEIETAEMPTDKSLIEEITTSSSTSIDQSTSEKDDGLTDKSEGVPSHESTSSVESTTSISKNDNTESTASTIDENDEHKKEKETAESPIETETDQKAPQIDTTEKITESGVRESTETATGGELATDRPQLADTVSEISSEEPTSVHVDDVTKESNIEMESSSNESEKNPEKPEETESLTEIPAIHKDESQPDMLEVTSEKSKDTEHSLTTTETPIMDGITQSSDRTEAVANEITYEQGEYKTTETSVSEENEPSASTSSSSESPAEISSVETKLNDQDTTEEISTTESEVQSNPIEETKTENTEPQLPDTVSTTAVVDGTATGSPIQDLMTSTMDDSGEPTQSKDIAEKEEESSHSTEPSVIISQPPEIEAEMPTIHVRPMSGIPGEGNCLVDGQSYNNNSAIPPANACQVSCRCVSSIVQCEYMQCSPPPADLPNCTPVYPGTDSCCPMYTCESTPSVELEAGNQMSDLHTPTYEEDSQSQTTQTSSVEESSHVPVIITDKNKLDEVPTEVRIQPLPEIVESTSIRPESDKESLPPVSPVGGETVSPISTESSSETSTDSGISVKISENEPSSASDENNKLEGNQSTVPVKTVHPGDETTESIQPSVAEDTSHVADEGTTVTSMKSDLKPDGQDEDKIPQSTESGDKLLETTPEDASSKLSTEISASTEEEITKISSTEANKSTDAEIEETGPATSDETKAQSQGPAETEASVSMDQTTVVPVESIDSETQKTILEPSEVSTSSEETGITSSDTSHSSTPATEDKSIIVETQKPEVSELDEPTTVPVDHSSIASSEVITESSTEPSATSEKESSQSSQDSRTTEVVSEESTTAIPDKHSTIAAESAETIGTRISQDDTTADMGLEKTSESSSIASPVSTEESLTVAVIVGKPEEESSPISTISEATEKIVPDEPSQESAQTTIMSPTESHELTSPHMLETTELSSEKEQPSSEDQSTLSSVDVSSEETISSEEKTSEETPTESQPETDEPEMVKETTDVPSADKSEELPKEETTEGPIVASEEPQTPTQESISLSTTAEADSTDIKIEPTESSVDTGKETPSPSAESTDSAIVTKISETEPSEIPEDKEQVTEASVSVVPKLDESSTPISEEPSNKDQEAELPVETPTEIPVDRDGTVSTSGTDELEITTKARTEEVSSHEPPTTIESTKVEAYPDEQSPETPIKSSDKELTSTVDPNSQEISTEGEIKSSSTESTILETSSDDLIPAQKPDEKEHVTPSNIPEEVTSETGVSVDEMQTISHDLQEHSTKGTDELSSNEPSESTGPEYDQSHIDAQQTDEPIVPPLHDDDEQRPIDPYSATVHPETSKPHKRPESPDQEILETDDENIFPPDGADIKNPFNPDDTESEDYNEQAVYGPGTCRYGGKIYMSAQQIPRDDACDFCFCFRSDIICLQQSCPPPIPGCHEEPIGGFCCPRYECPVSMATSLNITTTTTTTTTTLPPHFLSHAYKGSAFRGGCQIGNKSYRVGEDIKSKSGPCMGCT